MYNDSKFYSIKALFKLEVNARFADFNVKNAKGITKTVLSVLILGALLYFYADISKSIITSFMLYEYQNLFLILFLSIIGIAFIFSGVTAMEKTLFLGGNNELLLKYPVNPTEVFVAKALLQGFIMLAYNVIAELPIYIVFGVVTNQSAVFYILIPFIILLTTIYIFAVSTLLSIPFSRIKAYTRDRYVLTLVISIIVVAVGFAVYMLAVQSIMSFMQTSAVAFLSEGMMSRLFKISQYIVPFAPLAEILLLQKLGLSIPIALVFIAAVCVGAVAVIKKYYLKSIYITVESTGCSFEQKSKDTMEANFLSLLKKDFFEILRSVNYSFQYLAMSLAAPIMTYFCAKMTITVGSSLLGSSVLPSLSMLVVLIFVTIMVSFSATSISRMGDAFYMTKVTPIPYKIQVTVKFILYLFVALVVILCSVAILIIAKYVSFATGAFMFMICMLFAVAEICMSIKMDIAHPNFPVADGDELQGGTPNTFISMVVGFLVAIFTSVFGIVASYFPGVANFYGLFDNLVEISSQGTAFITLGIVAFIYAATMVTWLYTGLEKAYAKITPLR